MKNKNDDGLVVCPICGVKTFNTVSTCKCGHKFPYNPIQDELMVDICSNCREIKEYTNGMHIGGTYTVCPTCNNGKLVNLASVEKWSKMSSDEKQKLIDIIKHESLHNETINNESMVKCPYCKSKNTKKISGMSKAGSVALFGIFAMGKVSKQWHCNNCNSDF